MSISHLNALTESLESLFHSGRYSDFSIACRGREFRVHKTVLCKASKFFAVACDRGFKEAHEGTMDLSDDDPEALRRLLQYLYTADYTHKEATFWLDDLKSMKMKLEQGEVTFGTSTLDPARACSEPSMVAKPVEPAWNNMLVYALAEKYDIRTLKDFAKCKFILCLAPEEWSSPVWNAESLIHLVQTVYTSTPASDRGLRDPIACFICRIVMNEACNLIDHPGFREAMRNDGALALDAMNELYAAGKYSIMRARAFERSHAALRREMEESTRRLRNSNEYRNALHDVILGSGLY
ncbi:MAG: hypothetical protein Q9210_003927 [Variospora velana]